MDKQQITCIIVDDDNLSRETLEDYLHTIPEISILKSLNESKMAIKHLATLKPDIAFLDINMPQKDGIKVLNEINELGIKTKVVFVTGFEEYLLDALKKNAFDYLVKPVKKTELNETIDRFKNQVKDTNSKINTRQTQNDDNKIVIQNSHGTLLFSPEQIAYLEADGCYCKIHLQNGKTELISKNLGRIEKQFPKPLFFKISRSFIINIDCLNRIDRLRKNVVLEFNNKQTVLKASKIQLYDLEHLIHNR